MEIDMKNPMRRLSTFAIITGTVLLASCSRAEVNMNDFVEFDLDGYDAFGTCSAKLNYRALLRSVDGKIKDEQVTAARKILKNVKLTPEQIEKCRNGEKVEFEWDITDEEVGKLEEDCRLFVTFSDIEYEVSDLKALKEVDVFDDVVIEMYGYDSCGTVYSYSRSYDLSGLEYVASGDGHLKNGETVTITAQLNSVYAQAYKSPEEYLASLGLRPITLTKTLKVEGLSELAEYNPFSSINLEYDGLNGEGRAYIYTDWTDDYYTYWNYEIENWSGLANGDVITVKVTDYQGNDISEYAANNLGLKVTGTTKQFTVSGLMSFGGIDPGTISPDDFFCYLNDDGIYVDQYGNKIDLGGMQIVVRDWWSSGRLDEWSRNEYDEAQYAYWDEMQELYNFTIEKTAISDWGSVLEDFVNYACAPDDGKNYVFTLRSDPLLPAAMINGLMYDLSTLYPLDFSEYKFQANQMHEKYSYGDHIFCMYAGSPEPRTGIYFNKEILEKAGIDYNDIYDLQMNDMWTWDAFTDLCDTVLKKTKVNALSCNEGEATLAAVFSNGGSLIDKDYYGEFYYNVDSQQTMDALEWAQKLYAKYNRHPDAPRDAAWNYYQTEFLNGKSAFLIEQEYAGTRYNYLSDAGFDFGFVMFPKGPQGSLVNIWDDMIVSIPANYSKKKAGQIAFAWNLFTEPVPGWEDFDQVLADAWWYGYFDDRAKEETIPMMMSLGYGTVSYHDVIPDLNAYEDLLWQINEDTDIRKLEQNIKSSWQNALYWVN